MKTIRLILISAALCAAVVAPLQLHAVGNPPELIAYQGYLVDANANPLGTDAEGNPLPANYDVIFRIYGAPLGDNHLQWSEQQTLTIDNGYFSVLLGEGAEVGSEPNPSISQVFTGHGADERFMSVSVRLQAGGDFSEILPRIRLLSSPYAFLATQARSVVNPEGVEILAADIDSVTVLGRLHAQEIVASGGALSDINADNITSGTLHTARLPATISGNRTFTGTLSSQGWVGIGTATPGAPLDVRGFSNSSRTHSFFAYGSTRMGSWPYYATVNAHIGHSGANRSYSILAEHRIGAPEFNAFSDARIKNITGQSNPTEDIEILRKLRVTNYVPADMIGEGIVPKKGFIAQEVREILPEAVTAGRGFVPDIYLLPIAFAHDAASQELSVTLAERHGVTEGDRVRIFADEAVLELPVVDVPSAKTFVLRGCATKPAQVFVYGKEVPDFLTLNYDHIFTTAVSVIQELLREVEALRIRAAAAEECTRRIDSMEAEMVELRSAVDALLQSPRMEKAGMDSGAMESAYSQTRAGDL